MGAMESYTTRAGAARDVVILGSTGSIGTQAIDVVKRNPDRFRVVGLAAGGGNVELLARQALELGVEVVAVAQATAAQDLQLAFYQEARRRGYESGDFAVPKILAGPDAVTELAAWECDLVLNAVVGARGLEPTLAALDAGRTLLLANKESLIVGGPLVKERARPGQIVPVDSEHSALAQCLRGGRAEEVRRLIVTASGGPFRGWTREQMAHVTPEQALAHPTWSMGTMNTINSATLVNKGLEVIEAHLLFDIPFDRIEVVVHPQSIIHSMVEFCDGSTIAQASPPDMRLPIALGLGWPDRIPDAAPPAPGPRPRRGSSSRWTTKLSRPCGSPGTWARPAARTRRCTTPPTKSAWRPSSTGASRSPASSTPSNGWWPSTTRRTTAPKTTRPCRSPTYSRRTGGRAPGPVS